LLTGLTGQDGSFLAEQLLERGYRVIGISRRAPEQGLGLADHLRGRIEVVTGDLLASETLVTAVESILPDEIYHFGAPTFVPDSWRQPAETVAAIVGSTATLLETVRRSCPSARVFVAGSSEMFGEATESPQHENSVCRPRSPYGTAKLAAHQLVGQFRRHEGLFACSGILYNHESERRSSSFVTRKITRAAAAIKLGQQAELTLGDLGAVRDWSFAGDITRAAWTMLQHETPDDYILASGVGHTVRAFLDQAFGVVGLDADEYVRVDPDLVRAPEQTAPVGNPNRARAQLGWAPTLAFAPLVERMVRADLDRLRSAR
jgi:GDPmannose 4,6-dehydratase